jgi:hypothetical protein
MPDQVGDLLARDGPMVGDARDSAQRVVGILTGGVHLADDRVFGSVHAGQGGHRSAHTIMPMVGAHRLERTRRIRQPQFCCRTE